MRCARCHTPVATIELDVRDSDGPALMLSCAGCSAVRWLCDGVEVERDQLLGRLAVPRRSSRS